MGCSSDYSETLDQPRRDLQSPPGLLMVPGQLPAPISIRSVQLYTEGYEGNPPIIELGTNQQLILEFDEMRAVSGQYRISFTHHDRNWEQSSLPDPWIFDGVNELSIRGGVRNQISKPDYYHYSYSFPNRDLSFNVSGNYMLHVYDYDSNTELFSLPFFVTENEGEFITRTETVFNTGDNGAAIDQVFGRFIYPEYVEFPRYDLSYSVIQNRFWKRVKRAQQISVAEDGLMEFHLSRNNAFPASYEFSTVDLSNFSLQSPDIYNYDPSEIPPKVVLKDDQLNFTSDPKTVFESEFGFPDDARSAQYGNVTFRLNTGGNLEDEEHLYLLGDFNQWTISDRNRLRYNQNLGIYEATSLIKEGKYNYKYVTYKNGEIDDLLLNDSLTKRDQEYITFVYFLDPQNHYYRILNFEVLNSRY